MSPLPPTISPQAASLYRLLLREGSLTIKAAGAKMNLAPQGLYRHAETLEQYGCLKFIDRYPTRLAAKSAPDALNIYLQAHRDWFLNNFQTPTIPIPKNEVLGISFVQNRQESIEKSTTDLNLAKYEANFWVSGFEVPAETILAMKQAIQRGVRVRILAQVMDHSNETMFKSWIKLGIQVRASHLVETRIIIFDSQTVYLSSFNPSKRASGLGVRFSYQPIAILAKSIFFEQWERAKLI